MTSSMKKMVKNGINPINQEPLSTGAGAEKAVNEFRKDAFETLYRVLVPDPGAQLAGSRGERPLAAERSC